MTRVASKHPEVHRELFVDVGNYQRGRDVANLRTAAIQRIEARGIERSELGIKPGQQFTHLTWVTCAEAGHWLGLRSDTYLKTQKGNGPGGRSGVCTEGAQRVIREPATRNDDQLARARVRKQHLDGTPRIADEFLEREGRGTGPDAAVKWALAQVGQREQPLGSNWGGKIDDWIRLTGYNSPVPWCGCFVNAAIIHAGVPNGAGWIGYTPAIVAHARRGAGDWQWIAAGNGRRGDLALFDTPGGDPAVHVGIVRERISSSTYDTVEGNTGNQSQSEGNGVYTRRRSTNGSFRIIGFARPPY